MYFQSIKLEETTNTQKLNNLNYLTFILHHCLLILEEKVDLQLIEPAHEIMVLFVLHKLILQTHMHSNPTGLDVSVLVGPVVYFHTLCANSEGYGEQRRLWQNWVDVQARLSLQFRQCDRYHNLMSWLNLYNGNKKFPIQSMEISIPAAKFCIPKQGRIRQVRLYIHLFFRLLHWASKQIDPVGVDYVLQKLGFTHARVTIPKWMQRGFMDPSDKIISMLVNKLITVLRENPESKQ